MKFIKMKKTKTRKLSTILLTNRKVFDKEAVSFLQTSLYLGLT